MAQNKIVTSVSAIVDNIISPTENNVVCIDTKNSRIGVKKSQPAYEIDVSGQINTNILTINNGNNNLTTIDSSGITTGTITIGSNKLTSSNITFDTNVNYRTMNGISIISISGNIDNLKSTDLSCSSNLYVKSIRPYIVNNDISINGNLVIENSLNSLKTTNLIIRNINPFTNRDISINGNVWIDGSLNVKGTSTVFEMNVNYVILRSDDRLKHNEQNIENALSIIRQLNPQIYQKTANFKELHYRGPLNEPYIIEAGLIAQEVEKIDQLKFSVINGNKETPYSINYNNIFIYCLAALKELDNNVESIKNVLNLNTTNNSGSNNHDLINIINSQNIQIQELVNKLNILENRISTIERAF
jgi:hypothetical protein